jgi:two-component system chemotaxis response regulator CheY
MFMPKALVVDDSRTIRMILARTLGELGYGEVAEARNGREALEQMAAGEGIALALVDWNMPEMNGLEFVRRMRENNAWAGVKVVMVTTETEVTQMVKALEAGANEYVMKPFTRETIEDKLRLVGAI